MYREQDSSLCFSVALAKKFITRMMYPALPSNGMYCMSNSMDLLITDVLSSISAKEIQLTQLLQVALPMNISTNVYLTYWDHRTQ